MEDRSFNLALGLIAVATAIVVGIDTVEVNRKFAAEQEMKNQLTSKTVEASPKRKSVDAVAMGLQSRTP